MATSLVAQSLPRPIQESLRRYCYPAVLMARDLRVPLHRLQGATRGGQASVLVAGEEPWAFDLPRHLFRSGFEANLIRHVPVWRLNSVLEDLAPTADLVLARVGKLSQRLFFPSRYLCVPDWIDTVLEVPQDLDALVQSRDTLRYHMRTARKNGLVASVSHSEEDFNEFHRDMYIPFIRSRYGDMTWLTNERWLRGCFRRGGLIWIGAAGERLGGMLVERAGESVRTWAVGTRGGDAALMKKGVVTALYYHAVQYATECGCRTMEFGGTRAVLSDGVLVHKRRWGVRVLPKPVNQFYTLVRWASWNPSVASLLEDAPLIHQDGSRLTTLTAVQTSSPASQADLDKISKNIKTAGIHRQVVVNSAGWMPGLILPPSTRLVAGSPLASELVAAW